MDEGGFFFSLLEMIQDAVIAMHVHGARAITRVAVRPQLAMTPATATAML